MCIDFVNFFGEIETGVGSQPVVIKTHFINLLI